MQRAVYQAIQRFRKLLSLSHDYVDKSNGGSGSVTTIPASPEASRGTVSLRAVGEHEKYTKYDPIPYSRFDLARNTEYVTNTFNKLCSQVGVQCVVGKDPTDWKTAFHFKNVSHDKLIRVRWQENKMQCEVLLEPGEGTSIKVGGTLEEFQQYPEIKAFQYGVEP